MNRSKIRVALIGCGGIAALYRMVYARSPLCELRVFVDNNLQTARDAARECGADERNATTTLARALEDDVDAVVINTPNHLHLEQGLAAIGARKHVLIQKPLAATLEDAERLVTAASMSDRVSGIYHSFLDHPLYHDLRRRVAAGDFGPIVHAHGRYMHSGGIAWSKAAQQGRGTWRSSLRQTGGGCFIQLAVHYMQLISWITGRDATHVRGYAQNLHSPGIEGEDVASALFRYGDGMLASIETSWITEGCELSLLGAESGVTYLNERWFSDRGAPATLVTPPAMDDESNPYNGHRIFLEAIAGTKEIPVSLAAGLTQMREVDAFYRAARTGIELAITPVPEAPRVLTGDC
jgi:1,5-anhydro-D-fructose reductase (1,5-anhydro-D-mannitol-forming)